jgi:methyl-accepting chemotaxis protein
MKNGLSMRARFALAVAGAAALLLAVGLLAWRNNVTWQQDVASLSRNGEKQAAMADAQDTVWILRWELGNFMTNSEQDRKRILADEPALYKRFEGAMKRLGADAALAGEEKNLRDKVLESFRKYAESRPKFFQLWASGEQAQAHEWRAATTTKFGKEMTVALGELIALESKLSAQESVRAAAASKSATGAMSVLILVVLAVMVGAGAWASRSVLRQLGGEPAYAVSVAERVASGDLTVSVQTREGDSSSLLHALRKMRDDLAQAVSTIQHAAENVNTGAGEIARGNADLSSRTEEQASTLEETASSMEELTTTVKQNAESARQASQLAVGASGVAVRGGEVVREVVAKMSGISEASRKIGDIIGVIDGIAFQTNILALNAAVEAARAGEQGRGFAVVASEVRALAQRSAAAAKEIKGLIENSVERVTDGTKLVETAGETMAEIVSSVKRVTDIVSEIAAASQEQLSGIEQVSRAVIQMDQVVQQNAALVEESAAAAENLAGQAESLVDSVTRFKLNGAGERVPAQVAVKAAKVLASGPKLPPAEGALSRIERRRATAPAQPALPQHAPAAKAQPKPGADGEWKEF